jgi:hypothetical protein
VQRSVVLLVAALCILRLQAMHQAADVLPAMDSGCALWLLQQQQQTATAMPGGDGGCGMLQALAA